VQHLSSCQLEARTMLRRSKSRRLWMRPPSKQDRRRYMAGRWTSYALRIEPMQHPVHAAFRKWPMMAFSAALTHPQHICHKSSSSNPLARPRGCCVRLEISAARTSIGSLLCAQFVIRTPVIPLTYLFDSCQMTAMLRSTCLPPQFNCPETTNPMPSRAVASGRCS